MKELFRISFALLALAFAVFTQSGCSSLGKTLKALVGGKPKQEERTHSGTRFSEKENLPYAGIQRQYKRMNRTQFEEQADVHAGAGSLWVQEGQGAYLFSQNRARIIGDILNVRLDGAPRNQLSAKVKVISKLLERLERPALRQPAGAKPGDAAAAKPADKPPGDGAAPPVAPTPAPVAAAPEAKPDATEDPLTVETVATRIVDITRDGNYRVKGSETFMIGKREYKVIVTGLVRPEDFNDEGLSSTRVLDPQFDIVNSKNSTAGGIL